MSSIMVADKEVKVKEFHGKRVVTHRDIDDAHKRPQGTARRNFSRHKKAFIEGVDFFVRNSYEAHREFGISAPNGLVLLTESGYLMLVKSFTDDLAWQVQRDLVNLYFKVQPAALPEPKPEQMQLALPAPAPKAAAHNPLKMSPAKIAQYRERIRKGLITSDVLLSELENPVNVSAYDSMARTLQHVTNTLVADVSWFVRNS